MQIKGGSRVWGAVGFFWGFLAGKKLTEEHTHTHTHTPLPAGGLEGFREGLTDCLVPGRWVQLLPHLHSLKSLQRICELGVQSERGVPTQCPPVMQGHPQASSVPTAPWEPSPALALPHGSVSLTMSSLPAKWVRVTASAPRHPAQSLAHHRCPVLCSMNTQHAILAVSWAQSSACLAEEPPKQGLSLGMTKKRAPPLALQLELPATNR